MVVPVEDMTELDAPPGRAGPDEEGPAPARSIWPHVEERVLDLIRSARPRSSSRTRGGWRSGCAAC